MNIFILDADPVKAAQFHVDKHVVKMIVEIAQLLSTTNQYYGLREGYDYTHVNHPSAIWLRESLSNWLWTRELAYALNAEWRYRYNHIRNHSSYLVIKSLTVPPIKDKGITLPRMAMPNKYKQADRIKAYREYYIGEKWKFAEWRGRPIPHWWRWDKIHNQSELELLNFLRDEQIVLRNTSIKSLREMVKDIPIETVKKYLIEFRRNR